MADIKSKFGAPNQPITISIASLVTGAARSSLAIDNSVSLYLDVLVQLKVKTGSSGTLSTGYVNLYAYGTADAGTTYPEGAGTDVGVTLTSPPNVKMIGRLNAVANTTTYSSEPFSVAAAFAGTMPDRWGIIIENQTGGTLDTSEA